MIPLAYVHDLLSFLFFGACALALFALSPSIYIISTSQTFGHNLSEKVHCTVFLRMLHIIPPEASLKTVDV